MRKSLIYSRESRFFALSKTSPNFPLTIPVVVPSLPPLTSWAKNSLMRAVFKRGKKRTNLGRFSAISWEQLSIRWLVKVKFLLFFSSVFLASSSDFLTSWQELIILNLKALLGCIFVTNRFLLSRQNGLAGWVNPCWLFFSIATRRDREKPCPRPYRTDHLLSAGSGQTCSTRSDCK